MALLDLNALFGLITNGEDPITCYCRRRTILLMAKCHMQSSKAPAVQCLPGVLQKELCPASEATSFKDNMTILFCGFLHNYGVKLG